MKQSIHLIDFIKGKNKMWKIKKTERILDSEFVKVDKDDVILPKGREIPDFYKVTIKDCSAIVAIKEDHHIILKKEYRHCYKKELIEIPAGVLEAGEDPLKTAKRELLEETGYKSDKWTYLGKTLESSAKLTNYMHIYMAEDCKKVSKQKLDYGEDIEVIEVDFEEAIQMIMNNEIICNSSIGAILKVARIKQL